MLPPEIIQRIYEFNPEHRPNWYKVMNSLHYFFKDKNYDTIKKDVYLINDITFNYFIKY